MWFIEKIKKEKFLLISMLLTIYIASSLLEGERGLISYFDKLTSKRQLVEQNEKIKKEIFLVEKKNSLLSKKIDRDYLEILYRKKFLIGKSSEEIYIKE
jgi:cell division protein FtsB